MNLKPNHTRMEVEITEVCKSKDGWGSTVKARVLKRAAPRSSDFIKPSVGQILEIFAADDGNLAVGRRFDVEASVLGGPEGERVVLREAIPLADR